MPNHHPKVPPAPQPTKIFFDPFNSSSTGHQTAPSRLAGTRSWTESRALKLSHQFSDASGRSGARYISDLVGAGSENYKKDGRKDNGDWEQGAPGLREKGWQDIRHLVSGCRKRPNDTNAAVQSDKKRKVEDEHCNILTSDSCFEAQSTSTVELQSQISQQQSNTTSDTNEHTKPQPPQIFRGLTIYMNGSTAPLVSDHRLKHLLAIHGGNTTLALGRRTVTHVILGKTCGGGLAAGKIQKEISTVGGKGIKFVTAQWVLDSIEKGVRQPEGRYQAKSISNKIGGSGQKSVADLLIKNCGSKA